MVKIKRVSQPVQLAKTNKIYKKQIVGKNAKEAYKFYEDNQTSYKYNTKETKEKFKKMNYKRCSFCTKTILEFDTEMTIEHIRTKKDYPQKIFEWSNLLCACRTCNTKRSIKKYDRGKYLDPTKIIDIEKYFLFELDGSIEINKELSDAEQKKAKYMIEMYDLNRDELVYDRRHFMKKLMGEDDFYNSLKRDDFASQNIIFLDLFTYYRRCIE